VTKTETADSGHFMYIGKAFLSLLASVEGEYLDSIRTKLLPHDLSLQSPMPYRYLFHADSGVDLRPCSNHLDTRSFRPRLASTSDISDWRNCPDERFVPDYPASTSPATCYSAHGESTCRTIRVICAITWPSRIYRRKMNRTQTHFYYHPKEDYVLCHLFCSLRTGTKVQ
jgi:hypothetical protein